MNRSRLIGLFAGIALSVIACLAVLATIDVPTTIARIGRVEPLWLVPPLAVLAIQLLIRAGRWSWLLSATAGKPAPVGMLIGPLLVGYLVNSTLPGRLGEVARAAIAGRRLDIVFGASIASVLVERALDLVALVTVATVVVGSGVVGSGLVIVGIVAGLVVLMGVARYRTVVVSRLPAFVPAAVVRFVGEFLDAIARLPVHVMLGAIALSAVAWLGDSTLVWFVGRSLGIELPFTAAVAIGAGAALGTALPAAPGYLGTYELGAVAGGLAVGVPAESALAIALVLHVLVVIPISLAGAVAAIRMSVKLDVAQWTRAARPSPTAR